MIDMLKVEEPEICPICKGKAVQFCRCPTGHMWCANGHKWHVAGIPKTELREDGRRHTVCYAERKVIDDPA